MNQRERNELRRHIKLNQCGISKVYGCFVSSSREIISWLDSSLGLLSEFEGEKYLSLLKKVLSGTLGKNLIDIVFSTRQVMEGEEHKLLSALRESKLEDASLREAFFQRVIQSLDLGDTSYLILLTYDAYDVPYRARDDELQADASDSVYRYLLCAVCPVKEEKPELAYFPGDQAFHSRGISQIVSQPEVGFLFPAFDDRAANLYNALFYTRDDSQRHQELIDGIFHTDAPMSAAEQKETFQDILSDALDKDCSYDVLQSVHEQLRERLAEHKERKDPEPLDMSAQELGTILRSSGVPSQRVESFQRKCGEQFGDDTALRPDNLIDSKRFHIETPQLKISVDPDSSYLIEAKIIKGRKYLLIPADDGVQVNGVEIHFPALEE
ncbi:MAG: DUF4317 domain-containing protein [Clostridiales bacterium]|uniref:DUF4317 domain-containing protein n=1 Tax=Evtepia sp. TaxID=2773933 RepID=UPI0029836AFB|nr:DUF4317 domain-containing protein [Evtepia sp.]MDD7289491.1 DUF4317 domain-containing protein [Clostridiales bacterium]MDY3994037.1 DUF4317 domain-containing protein [Evtepia sp.]MDY4430511.1 DUF4317 domain-containing protein [Evtepia sp.]